MLASYMAAMVRAFGGGGGGWGGGLAGREDSSWSGWALPGLVPVAFAQRRRSTLHPRPQQTPPPTPAHPGPPHQAVRDALPPQQRRDRGRARRQHRRLGDLAQQRALRDLAAVRCACGKRSAGRVGRAGPAAARSTAARRRGRRRARARPPAGVRARRRGARLRLERAWSRRAAPVALGGLVAAAGPCWDSARPRPARGGGGGGRRSGGDPPPPARARRARRRCSPRSRPPRC
jgi:hypothetical protein